MSSRSSLWNPSSSEYSLCIIRLPCEAYNSLKCSISAWIFQLWKVAQHALITVHSKGKDWKDAKSRIRIEKQEYPQKFPYRSFGR
jgi:hypothetical protein